MLAVRQVVGSGSSAGVVNKRSLRALGWSGIVAALCLGWLAPRTVQAQTAHFSGTTIVLADTSFLGPEGVAVDGSGNVFVADSSLGVVVEMRAVNGSIPASPTINVLGSGFSCP
jgi:hypothetical protein